MLMKPQTTKFRQNFKIRDCTGVTKDSGIIPSSHLGIKIIEGGILNNKHMETLYANLLKKLRTIDKSVKIIWNVFPHIPYSKKPAEVRMGGGKSGIEGYIVKALAGQVILLVPYDFNNDSQSKIVQMKLAMEGSINKLPMKAKVLEGWI